MTAATRTKIPAAMKGQKSMNEPCPNGSSTQAFAAPAQDAERRRHPRRDCIAWQGPVLSPDTMQLEAHRPTFFQALLARLGLAAKPANLPPYGARIVAERDRRLPDIADQLEAILDELDRLEAWREASDVCSAIERLRARSAES